MFFDASNLVPLLDGKMISLAILSVALFITNTITIALAKSEIKDLNEDAEKNLNSILNTMKENAQKLDKVYDQQMILATAQLRQNEATARVIDGLIDALSEHQR